MSYKQRTLYDTKHFSARVLRHCHSEIRTLSAAMRRLLLAHAAGWERKHLNLGNGKLECMLSSLSKKRQTGRGLADHSEKIG